jgi:hypothetical protein
MTPRETFLSDIIVTALEGGIGYWTVCDHYQVRDDSTDEVRVIVGRERAGNDTRAVVRVVDFEGENYDDTPREITLTSIESGIRVLLNGSYPLAKNLRLAYTDNDAGLLDADDADCIVQASMFGEIVYD